MAKKPKLPAEDVTGPTVDAAFAILEQAAQAEAPADGLLAGLSEMVARAGTLESEVDSLSEMLAQRSAKLRDLVENLIPAAMDEAGVAEFTTSDGLKVTVTKEITGSLGKGKDETEAAHAARVNAALSWLDANGHDGIVKVEIGVKLARGQREQADRIGEALAQIGVDFKQTEGVHPATLKSFLKEQVENGAPLPLALFKVAEYRRAKLKSSRRTKE